MNDENIFLGHSGSRGLVIRALENSHWELAGFPVPNVLYSPFFEPHEYVATYVLLCGILENHVLLQIAEPLGPFWLVGVDCNGTICS